MAKETSKEHKKHADIARPLLGTYSRQELGVLGAPCGVIKKLIDQLAVQLKDKISLTYLDADHNEGDLPLYARMTDHISHDSKVEGRKINDFDRKLSFTSSDLLIINGNHFLSSKQIVICTEAKRASLQRKLDRLTDVGLIILDRDIDTPHDFLQAHISDIASIPTLTIDQVDEISDWVSDYHERLLPAVKGLVLIGGKSQRMGTPKEQITYHGLPQVAYATGLFQDLGIPAYISCRDQAQADQYPDQQAVLDTFAGLGPFGGILSAFRLDPNCAWFVIACDQPLLDKADITRLIEARQSDKIATCYHNPETGFPEPLITIWEPRAYQRLLSFLGLGYSCPRKVLINSDVHQVHLDDTTFMKNANTPEERTQIVDLIK